MSEDGGALPPRPKDHWQHRRRIAYVSLVALLVTLAAVFLDRVPVGLQELASNLVWVFAFLVLGYFGNNAMEAFAKRGKP